MSSTKKIGWHTLVDADESDSGQQQEVPQEPNSKPETEQGKNEQDKDKRPDKGERQRREKPKMDPEAFKDDQLKRLDEIESNEVWIFVFKNQQYNQLIQKKMQQLNSIKTMQSERGWDILVTKELVKVMLTSNDKKYPRFQLGRKNFKEREDRGGRRDRDRDRDGRNYEKRSYRDDGRSSNYEGGRKKYVQKNAQESEQLDQHGQKTSDAVSNEYQYKKKDKKPRRDQPEGSYKDRKPNNYRAPPRDTFGQGIGAFRLKAKTTEQNSVENSNQGQTVSQQVEQPLPKNLVEQKRQNSQIQIVRRQRSEEDLADLKFKKGDSTPGSATYKKTKYIEKKAEKAEEPEGLKKIEERKSEEQIKRQNSESYGSIAVEEQKKHEDQVKKQQTKQKDNSQDDAKQKPSEPKPKKTKKPASKKNSNNPFDAFNNK